MIANRPVLIHELPEIQYSKTSSIAMWPEITKRGNFSYPSSSDVNSSKKNEFIERDANNLERESNKMKKFYDQPQLVDFLTDIKLSKSELTNNRKLKN